jgi:hypothetical protein
MPLNLTSPNPTMTVLRSYITCCDNDFKLFSGDIVDTQLPEHITTSFRRGGAQKEKYERPSHRNEISKKYAVRPGSQE